MPPRLFVKSSKLLLNHPPSPAADCAAVLTVGLDVFDCCHHRRFHHHQDECMLATMKEDWCDAEEMSEMAIFQKKQQRDYFLKTVLLLAIWDGDCFHYWAWRGYGAPTFPLLQSFHLYFWNSKLSLSEKEISGNRTGCLPFCIGASAQLYQNQIVISNKTNTKYSLVSTLACLFDSWGNFPLVSGQEGNSARVSMSHHTTSSPYNSHNFLSAGRWTRDNIILYLLFCRRHAPIASSLSY